MQRKLPKSEINEDDPYSLAKQLLAPAEKTPTPPRTPTTNAGFVAEEGFVDWLYVPHTITALITFLVVSVYVPHQITSNHLRAGIFAGCCAFVFYGAIQFRDTLLLRPHPMVWRIMHAFGVLYIVFLCFLLYQPLDDIRTKILPIFDEDLGKPLRGKSYGQDCVMYQDGVMNSILEDTIFDIFVVAHWLGYAAKALMLRNWAMVWILSVMFEVLEASLQHMLPNFQECWWDHILLDIFGFNLFGMMCGMWLAHKLAAGMMDWGGTPFRELPSRRKKIVRIVWQLFPHKFERFHWSILVDFRRYCVVCIAIALVLINDLNVFFLKHMFWAPTKNPIVLFRLIVLSFVGLPACRELYEFAIVAKSERKRARLGQNAWVLIMSLLLESILVAKFCRREFEVLLPSPYITRCWLLSAFIFASWTFYQFFALPVWIHPWLRSLPIERARCFTWRLGWLSRVTVNLSWVPLLYILVRDCYRTYIYAQNPSKLAPIGKGDW